MRIIFMGTPQIAVPTLEKIIESRHEVIAVITQPDSKSGRGMSVKYSPVKEVALKNNIELIQAEKINNQEVLDYIESLKPDMFVVAAYAQKIPNRILEMAPYGCINLHPSKLPKYRGAVPVRGPILYGDEVTAITIMTVAEQWDAGDILIQEDLPLDKKETVATLEPKLANRGAELMLEAIDGIEAGTIKPVPQIHEEATYLKQISKEEGRIHFDAPAVNIERQIRACNPWPSAFTSFEGKTFKIWDADVITAEEYKELPNLGKSLNNCTVCVGCISEMACSAIRLYAAPGTVVYVDKHRIIIKTGDGYLQPNSVQLEGKKRMTMDEFLRGKKIALGTVFGE